MFTLSALSGCAAEEDVAVSVADAVPAAAAGRDCLFREEGQPSRLANAGAEELQRGITPII